MAVLAKLKVACSQNQMYILGLGMNILISPERKRERERGITLIQPHPEHPYTRTKTEEHNVHGISYCPAMGLAIGHIFFFFCLFCQMHMRYVLCNVCWLHCSFSDLLCQEHHVAGSMVTCIKGDATYRVEFQIFNWHQLCLLSEHQDNKYFCSGITSYCPALSNNHSKDTVGTLSA